MLLLNEAIFGIASKVGLLVAGKVLADLLVVLHKVFVLVRSLSLQQVFQLQHPVQLFPPEGFHIVYLELHLAEVLRLHTRVELVKAIFYPLAEVLGI